MDEHVIEAYHIALDEATDYQVGRAVRFFLKHHTGQHPPTAPEVLNRALKYEPSERAELARIEANRVAQLPRLEHKP
ncbi:hypothetical protein [Botrimarina mediterranea]|uniref:hypothetical protein n=1 Tax=Botrimarina mediterranea TaxID=2528022 RepID=UPI0011A96DED